MVRRQSRNAVDTYVCKCDVCVKARKVESSHAELLEALTELIEERTQDVSLLPFARIDQIKELITRATEEKQ